MTKVHCETIGAESYYIVHGDPDTKRQFEFDWHRIFYTQRNDKEFVASIYSARGSMPSICVNGTVALARHIMRTLVLGEISICANSLIFEFARRDGDIEMCLDRLAIATERCDVVGEFGRMSEIAFGSPHVVVEGDDIQSADIIKIGAEIVRRLDYGKGANVHLFQFVDENTIAARTIERGKYLEAPSSGAGATLISHVTSQRRGRALNRIKYPDGTVYSVRADRLVVSSRDVPRER